MFEGHDTTSAAVSWCLFLMGGSSKIQDRAFQEVDDVMGGDRNRSPTMKELGEMKYLGEFKLFKSLPISLQLFSQNVASKRH